MTRLASPERIQPQLLKARERRRSLAGYSDLNKTHLIRGNTTMGTAIPVGSFTPYLASNVTFETEVRITAALAAGLIFEIGDNVRAIAACVTNQTVQFHAGAASPAADSVLATYDNGANWPVDLKMRLTFALKLGTGEAKIFRDGREVARQTASGGGFSSWAVDSVGAFAQVASAPAHPDIAEPGAPTNFEVTSPLSAYPLFVPKHFGYQ